MIEKAYGSGTITKRSEAFEIWDAQRHLWGDVRLIQIHGNLVVLQGRKKTDADWQDIMLFAIVNDGLQWAIQPRKERSGPSEQH